MDHFRMDRKTVQTVLRWTRKWALPSTRDLAPIGTSSGAFRGWHVPSFQNREASGAVGFDGFDPVGQELQGLPSDPKYGPASVLAHPVFGFEMFDRKVPLKALRAEIEQRLQWAREITEGTDPEQVLAQVFALDSFAELLDTEIDEVILKEMESAPPPRRKR